MTIRESIPQRALVAIVAFLLASLSARADQPPKRLQPSAPPAPAATPANEFCGPLQTLLAAARKDFESLDKVSPSSLGLDPHGLAQPNLITPTYFVLPGATACYVVTSEGDFWDAGAGAEVTKVSYGCNWEAWQLTGTPGVISLAGVRRAQQEHYDRISSAVSACLPAFESTDQGASRTFMMPSHLRSPGEEVTMRLARGSGAITLRIYRFTRK